MDDLVSSFKFIGGLCLIRWSRRGEGEVAAKIFLFDTIKKDKERFDKMGEQIYIYQSLVQINKNLSYFSSNWGEIGSSSGGHSHPITFKVRQYLDFLVLSISNITRHKRAGFKSM